VLRSWTTVQALVLVMTAGTEQVKLHHIELC
jgi:hypothetical protein